MHEAGKPPPIDKMMGMCMGMCSEMLAAIQRRHGAEPRGDRLEGCQSKLTSNHLLEGWLSCESSFARKSEPM